ncbi:MAG: alpha/beta hydrolase [Cyclobacteriaceae bacterium]
MRFGRLVFSLLMLISTPVIAQFGDYEDHYIQNADVKLHYVTRGSGPVILFLHGFPDFWFTWKFQMDALSATHQVVAMDLRAYNHSEGPKDVDGYTMTTLMTDVVAVIDDLDAEKVTLIANDWGGAIAWQVATYYPSKVAQLVVCNIPHPVSLSNYIRLHPETADYTQKNESPNATEYWTIKQLMESSGAKESALSAEYKKSFERSNLQGMLHYYAASYPAPTKLSSVAPGPATIKKIRCPVLMIHGLQDAAFPPGTLNDHWLWIDNTFTLHTIPDAGHFVQREAPEKVLTLIRNWLASHTD